MCLVPFQAPQKAKLLRFITFIWLGCILPLRSVLQLVCMLYVLSLTFTVQGIVFSLPLSLGSLDRRSVGNNVVSLKCHISCV